MAQNGKLFQQTMQELEAAGTAQNRKIYRRHGAKDPLFGVSFANLDKMAKKIGTDSALGKQLWQTGNADARYLAASVMDPHSVSSKMLDSWAKDLDHYAAVDRFAGKVVAHSPYALDKVDLWSQEEAEFHCSAAWATLAQLAMLDNEIDDAWFVKYLAVIEKGIHSSKNRVRHEMNNALIAIGTRNDNLYPLALGSAEKIGTVVVDHAQTSCKTPDAPGYLPKARDHRKKKQAKAGRAKTPQTKAKKSSKKIAKKRGASAISA